MSEILLTSSSTIFALRLNFGFINIDAILPCKYPLEPSKLNFPSTCAVSLFESFNCVLMFVKAFPSYAILGAVKFTSPFNESTCPVIFALNVETLPDNAFNSGMFKTLSKPSRFASLPSSLIMTEVFSFGRLATAISP